MAKRRATLVILVILGAAIAAVMTLAISGRGSPAAAAGILVPALILAVVVGLVTALKRRRAASTAPAAPAGPEQLAAKLGLAYLDKGVKGFHHDLGPLPGIPRGGDIRHVMTGTMHGRDLLVFQHTYVVNTGQAVIPVHHTVLTTPAPPWPVVTVLPRRGLRALAYRLGLRRGLLLEDEAFNLAFRIRTDDEEFALTLLDPDLQQFLREHVRITWHVHAGRAAMIYGGAVKVDRLEASLDRLRRFWENVPRELEDW